MTIRRLVLDAHGVLLNNPLPAFLRELGERTREGAQEVTQRWRHGVRRDAWLGRGSDAELWSRLTGDRGGAQRWSRRLESRYARGPAAPHLERWADRVPVWLLSNHRSSWLHPRLHRLDVHAPLSAILVSDMVGVLKPEPRAFDATLVGLAGPHEALFVDDQLPNVEAARALGFRSVHAAPGTNAWVRAVDAALQATAVRKGA